jgi:hypothetical protein
MFSVDVDIYPHLYKITMLRISHLNKNQKYLRNIIFLLDFMELSNIPSLLGGLDN